MPGSKKDRKNGKESGGVVAAVMKHPATKFTNPSGTKASASPSPPIAPSPPEIKPGSLSSNENPVTSPLLDAASTASYATSNISSLNTREWPRGISAGMAGSPGNLISFVGESPPTAPSSYEDTRGGIASGWSSPRPAAVGYHPPSVSPPVRSQRPLSFHLDNHYSPPDPHGYHAAAAASRRSSMHSHFAQARAAAVNPPLPHQPQPHFYGPPELDLDPRPQSGIKAGERGYYFGFDNLPVPNAEAGKDVVAVVGYEGGLDVYSVAGKRGLEHTASLKGLRGGVIRAKILPWISSGSDLFPLIAVVIHGPSLPPPNAGVTAEGDYDPVSADRSEAMTNVSDAPRDSIGNRMPTGFFESYQTTVEVYSLKTGKPLSVLLEAPKIPLGMPITSAIFKPPPPTGAFHIHADGGTVVVSSGVTGECWIYRQAPITNEHQLHFRCHGKIWTTLQQPLKGDSAPETERGRGPVPPRPRPQSAIISINGRWIAYCPAAPSSQMSLRAGVPVPPYGRVPGLASLTPPHLPQATSDVDLPFSESVVNKIMRDATQELIQGAKWVGKQSWQAWTNYWNPQPAQPSRSPTVSPPSWGRGGGSPEPPPQFPPTHGSVTPPIAKEPGLVSILDVEGLGSSANVHPITTFFVPQGCSFLSFSPSAAVLFTASTKGDVQAVWDLMRIQYTKSSSLPSAGQSSGGPRVRQVAQFSRMTVARVVDIAWTRPNGERAAMVTERGTVHLLDMPLSAFTWPPPRRRAPQSDAKGSGMDGTLAVSMASNALSSVREVARPLISRPRRSNSGAQPSSGGGIGEYAAHGGKVIAAGISLSLGKTGNAISQLRHTGDNRVSLPSSAVTPGMGCVTWIRGRRGHSLLVLGGGLVRVFPPRARKTTTDGGKRVPRLSRYKDFKVPLLPDDVLSPVVKRMVDPDEYMDFTERDMDGANNTMVLNQIRPRSWAHDTSAESSIPQAEIESSAPYQPFHTDRRVALFEQDTTDDDVSSDDRTKALTTLFAATSLDDRPGASRRKVTARGPRVVELEQPAASAPTPLEVWVFGQPDPATKLDVGLPHLSDEESFNIPIDASRALPASAMERILQRGGDEDAQIVVTTRRRRGAGKSAGQEDDGFFEDDCEVLDFADQRV